MACPKLLSPKNKPFNAGGTRGDAYFTCDQKSLDFVERLFEKRTTIKAWELRRAAGLGLVQFDAQGAQDIDLVIAMIEKHGVRFTGRNDAPYLVSIRQAG